MQVVLIIFSVVLLGVIINYAFSVKSSRLLRLVALGALGLIALSLGVASIVIAVSGFSQDSEEEHLPIFLEAQRDAPKNRGNLVETIVCLAILAVIIVLIAVVYSRDRKNRLAEAKKASASPMYQNADKHDDLDLKDEEASEKAKEDDGFHLEL